MVSLLIPILFLLEASSYENGPVRAFVELKVPEQATVADTLTLSVTMVVPEVPMAEMKETGNQRRFKPEPPYRSIAAMPEFALAKVEKSISGKESAGFIVDRWDYRLLPNLPGEGQIPELTLVFWPNDESSIPLTITTEPIPYTISSMVEGDPLDAELKPAVKSIRPDRGWIRWVSITLIIAVWGGLRFRYWKARLFGEKAVVSESAEKPGASALVALRDASSETEIRAVLETAMKERFDVDLASLSRGEIDKLSVLPANLRANLAQIRSDLDEAAFARTENRANPELRQRVVEFLKSIS
tara:strand:- start:3521 stop:4420 length:900 start_codon:yes stop_codon:yes gene_type:complete